jgi:ubiquinone/menaquinone biosynthesis C-methylase UbiE
MASDAMRRTHNHEKERTALVRGYYDRVAHEYDSSIEALDRIVLGRGRGRLCSRARGRTLEIGVGTGANLAHYPPDASVTAIDLSPEMLAIAQQHAQELNLDIELQLGDAQALDFGDGEFDTVTATFLLSTVPDPQRAVFEMRRVLRPGGRVLLLDFARSPIAPVRWVEQVLKPLTARSRFSLLREPLDYFGVAELAVEHFDRWRCGVIVNRFRCVIEEVIARTPQSDREAD